ncbi:MAG: hypothetical protein AAF802_07610 [Planctomycetota bacterium]
MSIVDEKNFTDRPASSDPSNVSDAAAFVARHGWSIEAAAELTGADVKLIEKRLQGSMATLPFIPTPAMIREEAERLRGERLAISQR